MLIDRDGNILDQFFMVDGVLISDGDFKIALYFDDEHSRDCKIKIRELKGKLDGTDYKTLKYADGALSEEEYAETKKQRQGWRDEINKLEKEIKTPTITKEEIKKAEEIAMSKVEPDTKYVDAPLSL